MRPADIAELLKGLAIDVREYIAQALAPITTRQADLEERVAAGAIKRGDPGPQGMSAYQVALDAGFVGTESEWLASLRGPAGESIKGDRGDDGASVSPDDIVPLVRQEVSKQVADIPRPQDGKTITVNDVQPLLRDLVDAAVGALPVPARGEDGKDGRDGADGRNGADGKDGKDGQDGRDGKDGADGEDGKDGIAVTAEDVRPMLRELVDAAVAALPAPARGQDGTSVTIEDVRPLIEQLVAAVPPPKGISAEDLRPVVEELVDAAAAALPAPKDGTSVTLDDVRPLVEEAVAAVPIHVPTVDDLKPVIRELVDAAAACIPEPAPGRDGKSVTLDDVRPMIEEAVAALPKARDGENVPIEVVAALVCGEVAKAVGALPRPQDGSNGNDGRDGRDATAIEPLPFIDPARSYPRGTWAKHQRGLWLARTATDGMTGWDCIVAGVAAVEMTSDGLRTVTVTSVLSDGQTGSAEFVLPTMVYRGAWTAGWYEPGDTASWDGSMWHCEEKTSDRPGSSAAWRLCVKHGRDGKDGLRGSRGERGAEGKPGRDYNGNRT